MALPSKLKNFNVFNDAKSYLGKIPEVVLPKLTRQMESYRAGGMNGPVKLDLGQGEMEAEMTIGGMEVQIFKQYAATRVDAVLLRFAGAYQEETAGVVSAVEVVMRGRWEEIDPGNGKVGESNDMKVKFTMSYYKMTVDSEEIIEIDLTNMIERVNGVDMLAQQRQAVGL